MTPGNSRRFRFPNQHERRYDQPYIQKRGDYYEIVQRGTNKVLSRHQSREAAESAFRAMEAGKHGFKFTRRRTMRRPWPSRKLGCPPRRKRREMGSRRRPSVRADGGETRRCSGRCIADGAADRLPRPVGPSRAGERFGARPRAGRAAAALRAKDLTVSLASSAADVEFAVSREVGIGGALLDPALFKDEAASVSASISSPQGVVDRAGLGGVVR
jgi:hypothetical protein